MNKKLNFVRLLLLLRQPINNDVDAPDRINSIILHLERQQREGLQRDELWSGWYVTECHTETTGMRSSNSSCFHSNKKFRGFWEIRNQGLCLKTTSLLLSYESLGSCCNTTLVESVFEVPTERSSFRMERERKMWFQSVGTWALPPEIFLVVLTIPQKVSLHGTPQGANL